MSFRSSSGMINSPHNASASEFVMKKYFKLGVKSLILNNSLSNCTPNALPSNYLKMTANWTEESTKPSFRGSHPGSLIGIHIPLMSLSHQRGSCEIIWCCYASLRGVMRRNTINTLIQMHCTAIVRLGMGIVRNLMILVPISVLVL